jgi:pyruvate-formate lyase-activating enzyme
MSMLIAAVGYAQERGLGLFETLGVVVPEAMASLPPETQIVVFDRKHLDPTLRKRIELAAKPVKEPGKLARLLGRAKPADDDLPSQNGHAHVEE